MENKNEKEHKYREIKEQFCPNLGENAIFLCSTKMGAETKVCLSSGRCDSCQDCKHEK